MPHINDALRSNPLLLNAFQKYILTHDPKKVITVKSEHIDE